MGGIGREIRRRRKLRHLSQEELGKLLGCSQGAISQFENGITSAISEETAGILCRELGIDPGTLHSDHPLGSPTRLLYCNKPACPMNRPYLISSEIHFKPQCVRVDHDDDVFCPGCGTPMIDRCPNARCQAVVTEGATFCISCGTPFVTVPAELRDMNDPKPFVQELIQQRNELGFNREGGAFDLPGSVAPSEIAKANHTLRS